MSNLMMDTPHIKHRQYMKKYRNKDYTKQRSSLNYYKRITGLTDKDLEEHESVEEKLIYIKSFSEYLMHKKCVDEFEELHKKPVIQHPVISHIVNECLIKQN